MDQNGFRVREDYDDELADWDAFDWPLDTGCPSVPPDGYSEVFSALRAESNPASDCQLTSAVDLSRGIIRHVIGQMSREVRAAMLLESEQSGVSLMDLLKAWLMGTWKGASTC